MLEVVQILDGSMVSGVSEATVIQACKSPGFIKFIRDAPVTFRGWLSARGIDVRIYA